MEPQKDITKRPRDEETNSVTEQAPKPKAETPITKIDRITEPTPELPYLGVPALEGVSRPVTDVRQIRTFEENKTPTYKIKMPLEQEKDTKQAFEKIMNTEVALPIRQILTNSQRLREHVRQSVTPVSQARATEDKGPMATFMLAGDGYAPLKASTKVAQDPYLQMYQQGNTEVPVDTYIAKESEKLRTVWPIVNGVDEVEAILDSGSQIVSMSEAVAMKTGLTWDLDVTIEMQSTNRSTNRTLGLARNVPFSFGGLTVYLQVHILRHPAYTILLGRTFDTLTKSAIQNEADGTATMKIIDPNSDRKAVVPTFERGKGPRKFSTEKQGKVEDF